MLHVFVLQALSSARSPVWIKRQQLHQQIHRDLPTVPKRAVKARRLARQAADVFAPLGHLNVAHVCPRGGANDVKQHLQLFPGCFGLVLLVRI